MFSAPFLSTLLDRVKAIVRRVARPVAERTRVIPAAAPIVAISPVLHSVVERWVSAKLRALSVLTRRIETGERLDSPVMSQRNAERSDAPAARNPVPPEERLPRGFGWMCAFGPNAQQNGQAFAEWLNEPATRALVMAAPEKMAPLVGPLLNATGACRPDWLPALPKRVKRSFPACSERPGGPVDDAGPRGVAPRDNAACGDPPSPDASPMATGISLAGTAGRCVAATKHHSVGHDTIDACPHPPLGPRVRADEAEPAFSKIRQVSPVDIHGYFVTVSKYTDVFYRGVPRTLARRQ